MLLEAGPTGYVLYWQLAQLGVACEVIAPSLPPAKQGDRVQHAAMDTASVSIVTAMNVARSSGWDAVKFTGKEWCHQDRGAHAPARSPVAERLLWGRDGVAPAALARHSRDTYGANASNTLPGTPFWKPTYPEPTNNIPFAIVGPPAPIEPPLAAMPFTVLNS